jgi:hypothetical protein
MEPTTFRRQYLPRGRLFTLLTLFTLLHNSFGPFPAASAAAASPDSPPESPSATPPPNADTVFAPSGEWDVRASRLFVPAEKGTGPYVVAYNGQSNRLVVSDMWSRRLWQVAADGTISQLSGPKDWFAAVVYPTRAPLGICARSSTGDVFIVDAVANTIFRVAPDGTLHRFAGSAVGVAGTSDGVGSNALLTTPSKCAVFEEGGRAADIEAQRLRHGTSGSSRDGNAGGDTDGDGGGARCRRAGGIDGAPRSLGDGVYFLDGPPEILDRPLEKQVKRSKRRGSTVRHASFSGTVTTVFHALDAGPLVLADVQLEPGVTTAEYSTQFHDVALDAGRQLLYVTVVTSVTTRHTRGVRAIIEPRFPGLVILDLRTGGRHVATIPSLVPLSGAAYIPHLDGLIHLDGEKIVFVNMSTHRALISALAEQGRGDARCEKDDMVVTQPQIQAPPTITDTAALPMTLSEIGATNSLRSADAFDVPYSVAFDGTSVVWIGAGKSIVRLELPVLMPAVVAPTSSGGQASFAASRVDVEMEVAGGSAETFVLLPSLGVSLRECVASAVGLDARLVLITRVEDVPCCGSVSVGEHDAMNGQAGDAGRGPNSSRVVLVTLAVDVSSSPGLDALTVKQRLEASLSHSSSTSFATFVTDWAKASGTGQVDGSSNSNSSASTPLAVRTVRGVAPALAYASEAHIRLAAAYTVVSVVVIGTLLFALAAYGVRLMGVSRVEMRLTAVAPEPDLAAKQKEEEDLKPRIVRGPHGVADSDDRVSPAAAGVAEGEQPRLPPVVEASYSEMVVVVGVAPEAACVPIGVPSQTWRKARRCARVVPVPDAGLVVVGWS